MSLILLSQLKLFNYSITQRSSNHISSQAKELSTTLSSDPKSHSPQWSNQQPAAAALTVASAPRKPHAPAANSPPCTAPATRKPPRTPSRELDVRAVSTLAFCFLSENSRPYSALCGTVYSLVLLLRIHETRDADHSSSPSGARPAGQCTCDRASTENTTPSGNTCACGQRSAGSCTCEKAADGGLYPDEVDFTSKA
jgi:hypothetical protein